MILPGDRVELRAFFLTLMAIGLASCQAPAPRPESRPGEVAAPQSAAANRATKGNTTGLQVDRVSARRTAASRSSRAGPELLDQPATIPHGSDSRPGTSARPEVETADRAWRPLTRAPVFARCDEPQAFESALRGFAAHPRDVERMFLDGGVALDFVAGRLRQADVPPEFALLPMIESGYRLGGERAGRRRPSGPWQLVPGTARSLGLAVGPQLDERLDLIASTDAAIALLKRLYAQFDDWSLVLLAFNSGDGRIRNALRKAPDWNGDVNRLQLGRTTRTHLARLRALTCICIDPARYGVELPIAPALQLELSSIASGDAVSSVAKRLGVSVATLERYNPTLVKRASLPTRMRQVLVPRARSAPEISSDTANATDATHHDADPQVMSASTGFSEHVVARGESLWRIARRYRVRLPDLERWNALSGKSLLQPGQILRIFAP